MTIDDRRRWLALIVLCCALGVAEAGTPREDLDNARTAFRQKDCDSARKNLKDLLYPLRLSQPDQLFEAYAMLGASLFFSNRYLAFDEEVRIDVLFDCEHSVEKALDCLASMLKLILHHSLRVCRDTLHHAAIRF